MQGGRRGGIGRLLGLACALFVLAAAPANAACEIHPRATEEFIRDVSDTLYRVRSQSHLAQVIAVLMVIDREVYEHEMAHFHAAEGWASPPEYEYLTLYGQRYRIGGCVRAKPGIPLEIAYRAALAPKEPSAHDRRVAQEVMLEMQRLGLR